MSEQSQVAQRRGRVGGRWLNEQPTPEEFIEWFESSMKLDGQLDHKDYIGGVVLISAVDEKVRSVTGFSDEGQPIIDTHTELTYTPYARVETRIAYYWDLMDVHPEWVGVVEKVPSPRLSTDPFVEAVEVVVDQAGERRETTRYRQAGAAAQMAHQLPEGFSLMSVSVGDAYSHFICCTTRVSIYRRGRDDEPTGVPLRTGRGTKQVPLLTGYRASPWADPNSLMKAETGAMGRALGFAGIFVIPGSGVATAEDVLESMAQSATPAATEASQPATPESPVRTGAEQAQETEDQMRARAIALYKALSDESPGKAEEFGKWMRQRRHNSFTDVKGAALRGMVRKLEKLQDEAEQSVQQQPNEEPADVPGTPDAEAAERTGAS